VVVQRRPCMNNPPETPGCSICGATARLRYKGHHGYTAGTEFDIYHCCGCGAAFALPQASPTDVYALIYANAGDTPGYSRYVAYATAALSHPAPLNFLAQSEADYWAIAQQLRKRHPDNRSGVRVLEVGCGLGYLTYALKQDGFDASGIDISELPIRDARLRFGNLFQCSAVADFAEQHAGEYDCIILSEVVEHVGDIVLFLTQTERLLRQNGIIILTTPNRSFFHKTVLWETELPPVHLWWLSEQSVKVLARRLGLQVSILNLAEFYSPQYITKTVRFSHFTPSRQSIFDARGHLIPHTNAGSEPVRRRGLSHILKYTGLLRPLRFLRDLSIGRRRCKSRSDVLCAVLHT